MTWFSLLFSSFFLSLSFLGARSQQPPAPRRQPEFQQIRAVFCWGIWGLQLRDFRLELRNRVHKMVRRIFAIRGRAADGNKLDMLAEILVVHFLFQLNNRFAKFHANSDASDFIGILRNNVTQGLIPPEILIHS